MTDAFMPSPYNWALGDQRQLPAERPVMACDSLTAGPETRTTATKHAIRAIDGQMDKHIGTVSPVRGPGLFSEHSPTSGQGGHYSKNSRASLWGFTTKVRGGQSGRHQVSKNTVYRPGSDASEAT